jgi:hypothetical protein
VALPDAEESSLAKYERACKRLKSIEKKKTIE